ncbi:hypothetical protein TWF694_005484 [Orbilia ellipsospora]|uniref:SHSP domain-containing protein n=1 Tax=Orbilia ellipsospora TaxID=2528407 RepID=A0AAV9WT84_9PEZI
MYSFPRSFDHQIRPWVRLFDEIEAGIHRNPLLRSQNLALSSFTPSFDVRETQGAYIFEGELPGVSDKSGIDISFVDDNTLVIKGRLERKLETEAPIETEEETTEHHRHHPRRPSELQGDDPSSSAGAREAEPTDHSDRYWIRERYVGEFHRAFNFPHRVNQDMVKASLKDGVLTIVVPKKKGHDRTRRIAID